MKKIIYIILPCIMVFFSSCEDEFIDLKPLSSITEADYYTEPQHFVTGSNAFYTQLPTWSNASDFMDYGSDLISYISGPQQDYGRGIITAPVTDSYWDNAWSKIRSNCLLIERAANYSGDQSEIEEYVGVAKFFRAWNYYQLVQRFGGVPIVLRSLDVDSEELIAPRNSRYEVVEVILKDLEEAIAVLPLEQNIGSNDKGKISKWAAMAFKAQVLLYEATWIKNVGTTTDGDGITSGTGSEGYDTSNISLYLQEAVQLTKTVMDEGGYELWNYNTLLDNKSSFYLFNLEDSGSNPAGLDKATNKEFILSSKYDFALRQGNALLSHAARGRLQPSRKMMDLFLCSDGKTVFESPLFQGYVNASDEYKNRDYRLVSYFADFNTYEAPVDGSVVLKGVTNTGYVNQKFSTYEYGAYREAQQESQDYPHIRLATVYLMYAEALYELNGNVTDVELDESINKLKIRAGIPTISSAKLAANGMDLLEEIRRERAIELFAENSRYIDLKRWGIAEQELNKDICGAVIEGTAFENNTSLYSPGTYSFGEIPVLTGSGVLNTLLIEPAANRNFTRKNYLWPLPTKEIGLSTTLLQNPNY